MAPACPAGVTRSESGASRGTVTASPVPASAPAPGTATGSSAPPMRPAAYPAATAGTASSTPSGRPSRIEPVITDQAAQAPSRPTPTTSETVRLPSSVSAVPAALSVSAVLSVSASAMDAPPVDRMPRPHTTGHPRPRPARRRGAPAHRSGRRPLWARDGRRLRALGYSGAREPGRVGRGIDVAGAADAAEVARAAGVAGAAEVVGHDITRRTLPG
ncbi:hypothetical protein GCM10010389_49410 [Streptomyces echinoruber]|uniref:Uncharacterized protein n=1 Tax=Streptomyces echinoruber TaxID=68898 RepID=A0A918RMC0_9ACTN|nr:hypothetical protein GCM10010389_49410 [Streptomyces echinoruber]